MIDPDEYQRQALRTENTPYFLATNYPSLGRLFHAAMGCATEAGELMDMLKKHVIYNKPLDRPNVLEECGDLLWYIALALGSQGYTMSHCMETNINKLRVRFPDKYTDEQAQQRDLEAERKTLEDPYRSVHTPECDHGIAFDMGVASGLSAAEIRQRWPRLVGTCPKGCGFNGIAYASKAHFIYGNW